MNQCLLQFYVLFLPAKKTTLVCCADIFLQRSSAKCVYEILRGHNKDLVIVIIHEVAVEPRASFVNSILIW